MGLLITKIEMKHLAAYALLVLGGKAEPTAKDIEKFMKEAGAAADADKAKELCDKLKGKAFHELVEAGSAKLGSMGTGSGSAAPAGGAAKAEEPKEEAKKEESEEEDVDMGGLFGDDGY